MILIIVKAIKIMNQRLLMKTNKLIKTSRKANIVKNSIIDLV